MAGDHSEDFKNGTLCLHCRMVETYQTWAKDFEKAEGKLPGVDVSGMMIGAFIGYMTSMIVEVTRGDPRQLEIFTMAIVAGQQDTGPNVEDIRDPKVIDLENKRGLN